MRVGQAVGGLVEGVEQGVADRAGQLDPHRVPGRPQPRPPADRPHHHQPVAGQLAGHLAEGVQQPGQVLARLKGADGQQERPAHAQVAQEALGPGVVGLGRDLDPQGGDGHPAPVDAVQLGQVAGGGLGGDQHPGGLVGHDPGRPLVVAPAALRIGLRVVPEGQVVDGRDQRPAPRRGDGGAGRVDQVEVVEQAAGQAGAAQGDPGPGDQPARPGQTPGRGGGQPACGRVTAGQRPTGGRRQPGRGQPVGRVAGDQELDRAPVDGRLHRQVGGQGPHVAPDPAGDGPQQLLGHHPDPGTGQPRPPLPRRRRRLPVGRGRRHRRDSSARR